MVRKIILSTLLLILILGTTSLANVIKEDSEGNIYLTNLELDETTFQEIINYTKNNAEKMSGYNPAEILNSLNAEAFKKAYDSKLSEFEQVVSNTYNANINADNMILYINAVQSGVGFYFFFNNNTIGDNFEHLKFHKNVNHQLWSNYDGYYYKIAITNTNNVYSTVEIGNNSIYPLQLYDNITFEGETIIDIPCLFGLNSINSIYFKKDGESNYYPYLLSNYYDVIVDTPNFPDEEEPEDDNTGNITNPSGETTGNVDLSGIQNGITDINNNIGETNNKLDNISGELSNINNNLTNVPDISDTTITNEDITNNLDFEFMEDPYANFWFELTTGLSGALTNNVRTLDINWLGHIHTINLDNIGLKYPPSMELILKSTSTVAIVWVLVKWWKIIVDKLSSGNMDEVLAMNEEERNY